IKAEFTRVDCINFYPEGIQVNCEISRQSNNITAFNMNFTFTEDICDLRGEFNIMFQHGINVVNYTSFDLDFCKIMQLVHTTRLVQSLATGLRRVSNFPMSCPFKMNKQYYVHGFTLNSSAFPSYFPEMSFISDATFLPNQQLGIRLRIFGSLRRK
ncbi:hypothetical protein KR222_004936, partial [Zaprionus bogoriensis]